MSLIHAGGPGGDVSFLTVASEAPEPRNVIEPATCVLDGRTFYRQKYPASGTKRQFCRDCERDLARRDAERTAQALLLRSNQQNRRAS